MLQRITSFMMFKRHQVDISNQLEFCLHSSAGDEHVTHVQCAGAQPIEPQKQKSH